MSNGFPGKPKILRGAFVEYGLSFPPLIVVFQFNPVQLSRNRSLSYAAPGGTELRRLHRQEKNLGDLQKLQVATVQEQTIAFDIRLDASDALDDENTVAEQFGISPQIGTLELMVLPKEESLLGSLVNLVSGSASGFSFTKIPRPPLVLFVFGRKRVLPVNILGLNVTETAFSADLNPIQATVSVNLTVIEGRNVPYQYSRAMTEAMSALNIADVADVVVPG